MNSKIKSVIAAAVLVSAGISGASIQKLHDQSAGQSRIQERDDVQSFQHVASGLWHMKETVDLIEQSSATKDDEVFLERRSLLLSEMRRQYTHYLDLVNLAIAGTHDEHENKMLSDMIPLAEVCWGSWLAERENE